VIVLRKRRNGLVLAAALFAFFAGIAGPSPAARAQQLPTTIAAVIDYQRILKDAAAAKSIREQIETRRKAYQDEINKEEQRLREADQSFAKQRSLLTPEALAEKRRDFEKEVVDVQRMVQERRRALDRASAIALNEVKKALVDIVTGIAEERGFNVVLAASEVLFFASEIDITEEVLAKLDGQLPEVAMPDPEAIQ
jgi:outer membrane protein